MKEAATIDINEERCFRLIQEAIAALELNLLGYVILTEAATGYYLLTPLIGALGGANRVYAIAADSQHGSSKTVKEHTMALANRWGVADRIEILFSRDDKRIGSADIVTNLGFVRPLDVLFLRRLKPRVVIPLMFETWEYRPEDLDLQECHRLGIPVAGTNEHHPLLRTLTFVGHLAIKLLFELEVEVFQSKIVVIGSGEFGREIVEVLSSAGAYVQKIEVSQGESLRSNIALEAIKKADAIVIAEHQSRRMLIGSKGEVSAKELQDLNSGVVIAHISGNVDYQDIRSSGIPCNPETIVQSGHMSLTTDYLGPRPLIFLHTAGLKVGQAMAEAVTGGKVGREAEMEARKFSSLVQSFD